jgi:pimeloyl-ACP methyl ester carboxylesterase
MDAKTLRAETPQGWLAYRQAGAATPSVVCIHGFCQSSEYWAPTIERLATDGIAAVAVDLPGFGDSAAAPGPYTMEGYADLLAAMLDAFGVEKATVIGGSMGGVVAQHFAIRHPDRLEKLVLVATGARTPNPAAALEKADAIERTPWTEEIATKSVQGFFHRPVDGETLARYRDIVCTAARPAAASASRSNGGSNTLDQLADIAAPTLIVQGAHDTGRTPEHGALMASLMPNARLAVLPNSGHTPQLEEPEAFLETLAPFLSGTE